MKKMMFNDRFGLTEAVLQGRKTVTRRTIIAPNWACDVTIGHDGAPIASDGNECADRMRCECIKPPYRVDEIVAVAQSYYSIMMSRVKVPYKFDMSIVLHKGWTNKMHVRADLMPHQIRILDIRAERLQDITEEDCLREGVRKFTPNFPTDFPIHPTCFEAGEILGDTAREAFTALIDKVCGRGTWGRNPYVWRIEFELAK